MRFLFCFWILVGLIHAPLSASQSVARGRNEGTLSIPASNVVGNGNITAHTHVRAGYGANGPTLSPSVGGMIGIGGVLQAAGNFELFSLQSTGLGLLESHLQATIPGNDNFRFLGAALRADLYLSTALDTISATSDAEKPDYNPYLYPSIIVDFDFLAKWKQVPLKAYLFASMADNPQLLHQYRQVSLISGLEWKMFQHSVFADMGIGFYKEKATRLNRIGDKTFQQYYAWVQPGGRYRLFRRFSLTGGFRFVIRKKLKEQSSLHPALAEFSVRLEAPVYFRETNTEAIRSLVFIEQSKEKSDVARSESMPRLYREVNAGFAEIRDSTETFDYSKEKQDLIQQRKEIRNKMEEIELLFEGLDEEVESE